MQERNGNLKSAYEQRVTRWKRDRPLDQALLNVVPDLVDYARRITGRPDWRFTVVDHLSIPEQDGQADVVCFFSVLTHLLHVKGYWSLQEARRVLGGLAAISQAGVVGQTVCVLSSRA